MMRRLLKLLVLLLPLAAQADERILGFHSDILVRADAVIEVTETIQVRAEGQQIRRGIYRDFPTRYRDRYGNRVHVNMQPLSVLRDDRPDGMRSERYKNGLRTYFGRSEYFLPAGEYTYTFRYDAERLLGFFGERDELYWNVTGGGWAFPIDHASATVRFDFPVDNADIGVDAWTGRQGTQGKDYEATTSGGVARFETATVLGPGEQFTVLVNWPAGSVAPPGAWQKFLWMVGDNRDLLIALAGLVAMLCYCVPVWRHFGRDPEPGVRMTRYEPPASYSPASLRYIRRMGYDTKVFTAAVVNLAVKGYLRIQESGDSYSLLKTEPGNDAPGLAKGERELLDSLFEDYNGVLLDDKNHKVLSAARLAHSRSLRKDYRNRLFRVNGLMNLPNGVIFVMTILFVFGPGEAPAGWTWLVLLLMAATASVFAWLIKAPTGLGRRVLDEIDGFEDYLAVAEKDEIKLLGAPQKTPQLYEHYLPFALALGVEQAWADKFTRVFANLRGEDGVPYHPGWYDGSWNASRLSSHASSLGSSFSSAISSSMSPPGSSSGSGGGGSSGGGGGGGGGGGW